MEGWSTYEFGEGGDGEVGVEVVEHQGNNHASLTVREDDQLHDALVFQVFLHLFVGDPYAFVAVPEGAHDDAFEDVGEDAVAFVMDPSDRPPEGGGERDAGYAEHVVAVDRLA